MMAVKSKIVTLNIFQITLIAMNLEIYIMTTFLRIISCKPERP